MTDPTFALVPLWQKNNSRPSESYRQAIDKILKSCLDDRIQVLN